jgi:hypothetical protein
MKSIIWNARLVFLSLIVFGIPVISYAEDTKCYTYKPAEDARSCWDLAEDLGLNDNWADQTCDTKPCTSNDPRTPPPANTYFCTSGAPEDDEPAHQPVRKKLINVLEAWMQKHLQTSIPSGPGGWRRVGALDDTSYPWVDCFFTGSCLQGNGNCQLVNGNYFCKPDPATSQTHRVPKIIINMEAPCTLPGGGD